MEFPNTTNFECDSEFTKYLIKLIPLKIRWEGGWDLFVTISYATFGSILMAKMAL